MSESRSNRRSDEKPVVRVFVSSPGDVWPERQAAGRVLSFLRYRFAHEAVIEPYFWEYEPMSAYRSYQGNIPTLEKFDICVCLLWSRMGTPLPVEEYRRPDGTPYSSGTEYEFETAFESYRAIGKPDLLIYHKRVPPRPEYQNPDQADDTARQFRRLSEFIERWTTRADGLPKSAKTDFRELREFESLLEAHLETLIDQKLGLSDQRGAVWDTAKLGCPFRALDVFEKRHAPIFFGRDADTNRIIERLKIQHAAGRPFVLILGPSGSGKSSLARAGVLARVVDENAIPEVGTWRYAVMRPSEEGDPVKALAKALGSVEALPALAEYEDLGTMIAESPSQTAQFVHRELKRLGDAETGDSRDKSSEARLILIVDQLEELFAAPGVSEERRTAFATAIGSLVRGGRTWVVATLRSDFYDRLAMLPELASLKDDVGLHDLGLPGAGELGKIIVRPARAAGLRFEEDRETGITLDDRLREDAAASPASLPLLEFCLTSLYEQSRLADAPLLTFASYEAMGGLAGSVSRSADVAYESLNPAGRKALPRVFRHLIRVAPDDGKATRLRARRSLFDDDVANELIDAFVAARLLTLSEDTVEVAHEALWTHWTPLAVWLEGESDLLRSRARIESAAAEWLAQNERSDRLLPSGGPLEEGRAVAAAALLDPEAQRDVLRFVRESSAADAVRRRTRRAAVVFLALATAIATASAAYAFYQRDQALALANDNARLAHEKTELAQDKSRLADEKTKLAEDEAAARQLAVERQRDAEEARKRAETIQEYLLRALESPSPFLDGRQITIASNLSRFVDELDSAEVPEPTRNAVLLTIARSYIGLGLAAEAVPLVEEVALWSQEMPLSTESLGVDSEIVLAEAYQHSGDLRMALATYEAAASRYEATVGFDDERTLDLYEHVAELLCRTDRRPEGIALAERTLARKVELFGERSETVATAMATLSTIHQINLQPEKAFQFAQKAADLALEIHGDDDPRTWIAQSNLASAHRRIGQAEPAIALHTKVYEKRRARLGENHHETLLSLNNLCLAMADARPPADVLPRQEELVRVASAELGLEHGVVVAATQNLAGTLLALDRTDESIALYERAYKHSTEETGAESIGSIGIAGELLEAYWKAERVEDYGRFAKSFWHPFVAQTDKTPYYVAQQLMDLAQKKREAGDFRGAEQGLRDALTVTELVPTSFRRAECQSELGALLVEGLRRRRADGFADGPRERKTLDEAKDLLDAAFSRLDHLAGDFDMVVDRPRDLVVPHARFDAAALAAERLVAFHESRGNPDEAVRFATTAEGYRRKAKEAREEPKSPHRALTPQEGFSDVLRDFFESIAPDRQ